MMNTFAVRSLLVAGMFSLFTGCSTLCRRESSQVAVQAVYTAAALQIDGHLNEADWKKAPVYQLQLGQDVYKTLPEAMKPSVGKDLHDAGEYRLLWDDNYLYVGAVFTDLDVHAYGEEDQLPHFSLGDVAEVFIKPESDTYYWELYATPANKMTTYFIPGRGTLMNAILTSSPFELKVAAQVKGTLNKWADQDESWSMEMAIPRKELEKYGAKFAPDQSWRVFLARYNYSRYLQKTELSSFPQQAGTPNFHFLEEYGRLELLKP